MTAARHQAEQCLFEPMDERSLRRLLRQARAEDIVRHFFACMHVGEVPSEIRPRDRAMADRVAARLADSFRDPLSVRELAVQASVSVSKLSRTFKAVHGVTLSEYEVGRASCMESVCWSE